jgi:hypothetical protein
MSIYHTHTSTMQRTQSAHSVTFLDNHDTAGELKDRFGTLDQILMGYAVLSPPMVSLFSSYKRSLLQKITLYRYPCVHL